MYTLPGNCRLNFPFGAVNGYDGIVPAYIMLIRTSSSVIERRLTTYSTQDQFIEITMKPHNGSAYKRLTYYFTIILI